MCDEVSPLNAYAHAQLHRQHRLVDERNIAFFLCCRVFSPFLLHAAAPAWLGPLRWHGGARARSAPLAALTSSIIAYKTFLLLK